MTGPDPKKPPPGFIDIAEDLLHDIEKHDAEVCPGEETIEDRALASRMRKQGCSEEEIFARFGYSPTPIPPRVRPKAPRFESDTD